MFDQNGHLRDQAIAALVSGEELDALTRLEPKRLVLGHLAMG